MTTPANIELDLAKLRRQDVDEFTRFVRAYEGFVLGLCQTLGLMSADADDAAAETFAQVYRALPSFRADAQISTWLYRIAYRTAIKVRRRYPKLPDTSEIAGAAADPQAAAGTADVENQETAAAVWHAVARLDPEQAAVVELFYRRGMAVDEVAEILDKPTGTVKTLLFRARERLRTLLKSLETT